MTNDSVVIPLALLADASGARSMTGLAAVARATHSRVAAATTAAAAGELVADKLPGVPDRTASGPIVGRALAGAIVGAVVADRFDRDRVACALAGEAIAVVSAHLTFRARRAVSERVPPLAAALVEDVIVVGAAAAAAAALP